MGIIHPQTASRNLMTNMNLGGYAGRRLAANEAAWLHHVLEHNPGIFDAFARPEENDLAKVMWHGEFPGKILTGMAQTLRAFRNLQTLAAGNALVQRFKSVQGEDGYLGPWPAAARFDGDKQKWDTWGHYHCIYGLYQWYKATGSQDALDVAVRAADCVYDHFIAGNRRFVSQNWAECNFAISHAFAILYQETGDKRYLEACERIIRVELKLEYEDYYKKRMLSCDWLGAVKEGKAYYQSNQTRWEGLHTLLALVPLYEITGDEEYYHALKHLWQSIVDCDRHNFGGFGTGEAAEGKPYAGGSETCNTIAWMALSTEWLKLSRLSAVADELELSFYNAALGSLVTDYAFSYMNPMSGERDSALVTLENHGFEGGKELSCCQANGTRGISQLTEWAVLTDEENIYLNYYGQSDAESATPGGSGIRMMQETDYPRSGMVRIKLELDRSERFKLNLRVPSWSASTAISVAGECFHAAAGHYFVIDREWQSDDTIDIQFDMSVRYWVGEQECAGLESVYRGPVLLAASWPKIPAPTDGTGNADSPANTELQRSDVDALRLTEDPDGMLCAEVNVRVPEREPGEGAEQTSMRLVAYADAWKDGQLYETWFRINESV